MPENKLDKSGMMSDSTWQAVKVVLENKRGFPAWNPTTAARIGDYYFSFLKLWPDPLVQSVFLEADATLDERPSRAQLNAIAVRQMRGPLPEFGEVWAEVMDMAALRGEFACPDPDNPRVFRQGEPPWSDPLVARTVAEMGGYLHFLANWPDKDEGTLRAQMRRMFEQVAGQAERRCLLHFAQRGCLPEGEPLRIERYVPRLAPGAHLAPARNLLPSAPAQAATGEDTPRRGMVALSEVVQGVVPPNK